MIADPESPLFASGDVLLEKYEVVRVIGVGGMGVVYEGRHRRLNQRVAIKTLHRDLIYDAEALYRFEREARAAAMVRGRHIARVTDVDSLPDGTPFMVLEYLTGRDLRDLLVQSGPFQHEVAVGYALQACKAMAQVHAAGIFHRDLKPRNLFVAEEDNGLCLKVLDFGISKVTNDTSPSVTGTRCALGTPTYMSPEQIRSAKHVDERADIWSLGVILYELLNGKPPFDGANAAAVVASVTVKQPVPLSQLRPDIPQGLCDAVMQALEKDPAKRFPDMPSFAAALAPYRDDSQMPAVMDSTPPEPTRSDKSAVRTALFSDAKTLQLHATGRPWSMMDDPSPPPRSS